EVATEGRTIIFVSHNMAAIQNLCSRAYLVEHGHLVSEGPPIEVIARYLGTGHESSWTNPEVADDAVWAESVEVRQNGVSGVPYLDPSAPVDIEIRYMVTEPVDHLLLGFDVFANDGVHLCRTYDFESGTAARRSPGRYV